MRTAQAQGGVILNEGVHVTTTGGGRRRRRSTVGAFNWRPGGTLTRKSAMKVTGEEKRGTVANFTPTSALKVTLLGVANMGSCESEPTQSPASRARCRGLRTARMDRTRYPLGTYTSAHKHTRTHPHTHMHTQQYNAASHIELDNGTNRLTPTPSEWHLTKFKVTLGQGQLRADIRILLEWRALLWPR